MQVPCKDYAEALARPWQEGGGGRGQGASACAFIPHDWHLVCLFMWQCTDMYMIRTCAPISQHSNISEYTAAYMRRLRRHRVLKTAELGQEFSNTIFTQWHQHQQEPKHKHVCTCMQKTSMGMSSAGMDVNMGVRYVQVCVCVCAVWLACVCMPMCADSSALHAHACR